MPGLILGTLQIYLSSQQSYQVASTRISISDEKEVHRGLVSGRAGIHSLDSLAPELVLP